MTQTGNTLIDETRRHLHSGSRDQLNTLAAAVNSGATTITTNYSLKAITEGSLIEIDLELMYVLEVNSSASQATVLRGQYGTTAAAHLDDAVITANPRFPRFSIFTAINEELASLSAEGLFRVVELDLTYNPAIAGYDLTGVTDILDIYSVRYQLPGPEKAWPRVERFDLIRNMPTSDFASGLAVVLYDGGSPSRTIRVAYRAPFDQLSDPTDVVTTVSGIHEDALDILPLGAAARLVAPRDVKRAEIGNQGDTRRADEVPVGANMASARGLLAYRDRRVQQEIARLRRFYPASLVG